MEAPTRDNVSSALDLLKFTMQMQVIDDFAKFDLVLKVKRGNKEEKYKVEVHKNNEGNFHLNQMEQDSSWFQTCYPFNVECLYAIKHVMIAV